MKVLKQILRNHNMIPHLQENHAIYQSLQSFEDHIAVQRNFLI